MEQRSAIRNSSGDVQSLARAVGLLECFKPHTPSLSLAALANATGLPKATVHRLTQTLCATGVLRSDTRGIYQLGIRLVELGDVARLSLPVYRHGEPLLEELAKATDFVAFLCVPDGLEALYVARVHSPAQAKHGHLPIGARLPLTLGAGPVAILAFMPEEVVTAALATPIEARTPYTVTEPEAIRSRLAEIRDRGFAVSWRDVHTDTVGVGAPVFDSQRDVVGAVSLGGPLVAWTDDGLDEIASFVVRAAGRLSRSLGFLEDRLSSTAL